MEGVRYTHIAHLYPQVVYFVVELSFRRFSLSFTVIPPLSVSLVLCGQG